MNQPQQTKKHHFVPECYLKNFILNDSLYTLDIQKVRLGYKDNPKKAQPGGICYKENYYRIEKEYDDEHFPLDTADNDLFIEHTVLRSFENKYPQLFKGLTEDGELSFDEAATLCDFLIQLKLRNPFHFENTLQKNKDSWLDIYSRELFRESFQSDFPFAHIPIEVRKMCIDYIVAKNKSDIHYDKKVHLSSLLRRFNDPSYDKEIFRNPILTSNWTVFIAPENGPYFITSDNPGFAISFSDNKIYSTKFDKNFCFHFPLSPRFCLLISDLATDNTYFAKASKPVYYSAVNGDTVIHVNDRAIQRINKLLIASDNWYLTQIGNLNRFVLQS